LIQKYGAGYTSQFGLLVPIVGMSSGALLLGEPLGSLKLLAAAFVIAGLSVAIFGGAIATFTRRAVMKTISPRKA
jgi:O-acetylserine/cysteine efflux transporter